MAACSERQNRHAFFSGNSNRYQSIAEWYGVCARQGGQEEGKKGGTTVYDYSTCAERSGTRSGTFMSRSWTPIEPPDVLPEQLQLGAMAAV